MLEDYTSKVGSTYEVSWEGFILFALLVDTMSVYGLHDQDFIHNGKKLINPLDSPVHIL